MHLAKLQQREQLLTLVEKRRLGRVQLFRAGVLCFLQDSAAERDGPAAPVGDRKHYAVAEVFVFVAALAALEQTGFFQQRNALVVGAERALDGIPLIGGVAEPEALDRFAIESARVEIRARLLVA